MLLSVVLLFVGAGFCVNGIWLIGQSRAAVPRTPEVAAREPVAATAGSPAACSPPAAPAENPVIVLGGGPFSLQDKEVTVVNLFVAFVGLVAALTAMAKGVFQGDPASIQSGGFILLFAFAFLWIALNHYLKTGARALGWYCLFVAVTAVPAGIYALRTANGNTAALWLALDWFAWAVMFLTFWVLLALERPVARFAGWFSVLQGLVTAWPLALALMLGVLSF